ncbi:hypothetical protein AAIB41_18260 [Brucella sp. BE17]|uniref:hypothetical protein n=1 Tax=Brucella sp. BE17 TaxID=3142977 RepID=UPI0031BA29E9
MIRKSIYDRIMSREGHEEMTPESEEEKKKLKRMKSAILFSGALVLLAIAGFSIWQLPMMQRAFSYSVSAQKASDPSLEPTLFLEHTKQAGLTKCSNVYPVLGRILTNSAH